MRHFTFFFSTPRLQSPARCVILNGLCPFGLATFQVLSGHTWLVATALAGIDLGERPCKVGS